VLGGPIEAVVVVPLERRAFGAAVLAQVVDVGFALAPAQQQVVAGGAGGEVSGDLTVEGVRLALGQAAGLAVEAGAVVAAVQVDRELTGAGRQPVLEGDLGPLPGGAADRRPGEGAAVGPQPGRASRQDLRLGLADRDLDLGVGEDARDRQPRLEGNRSGRGRLRLPEQAQLATAQRQQGRERAAAEGAEESSAPQARR
jgi:hypothetical protein